MMHTSHHARMRHIQSCVTDCQNRILKETGIKVRLNTHLLKNEPLVKTTESAMAYAEKVTLAIVDVWGISVESFFSKTRSRPVADARKVFCKVMKMAYPDVTLKAIGEYMGGRDHSTVIVALEQAESLLMMDQHFADKYFLVLDTLKIE